MELLEKKYMAKYFVPKIEEDKVILYIRPEVWEQERYLDGKFFLKPNLDEKKLSSPDVVQSYKQLQEIERAFREIKDFLKLRPIFHYSESRVKAHIFICVLAYLFEKIVHLECQRASLEISGRRAFSLLSRLKAIECRLEGQTLRMTNRMEKRTESIFQTLEVPQPPKLL